MNTLSEKIRYKRVCKITEVCDTLKGKLLKFTYNAPNENKSEIINSNEMIYHPPRKTTSFRARI